ncbi:MAG: hypothetical protein AVDCRST_MAG40-3382, partial [uncultured Gemmatimonadaceae bacterium]
GVPGHARRARAGSLPLDKSGRARLHPSRAYSHSRAPRRPRRAPRRGRWRRLLRCQALGSRGPRRHPGVHDPRLRHHGHRRRRERRGGRVHPAGRSRPAALPVGGGAGGHAAARVGVPRAQGQGPHLPLSLRLRGAGHGEGQARRRGTLHVAARDLRWHHHRRPGERGHRSRGRQLRGREVRRPSGGRSLGSSAVRGVDVEGRVGRRGARGL